MELIINILFGGILLIILIFLILTIRSIIIGARKEEADNLSWKGMKDWAKDSAGCLMVEALWPVWIPLLFLARLWIYIRERFKK